MKYKQNYLIVASIALIVCGIFLIKTLENKNQFILAVLYICVALGCGIFGHSVNHYITNKSVKNNPEIQKQIEILHKDERTITISNRAKAKGFDLMSYAFIALLLVLTLMKVALAPLLILVFTYLLVQAYALYYRIKYDKEM